MTDEERLKMLDVEIDRYLIAMRDADMSKGYLTASNLHSLLMCKTIISDGGLAITGKNPKEDWQK